MFKKAMRLAQIN